MRGFTDVMQSSIGAGVTLHLDLPAGLPPIVADPEQLEMALLNIVINGRDAMADEGTITIATSLVQLTDGDARDLAPGDYVALAIVDGGAGMAPDVAERALEPFFTTKPVGKGTGLGLPMASGFARQSRGRLEIDSTLGHGTTVRILLPVATDAADQRRALPEAPVAAVARDRNGLAEHLLVVDDSGEVLALAEEILRSAGYRVVTATSAEDGLRAFDAAHHDDPFDLVFTDLVMPGGMNGLALADAIGARDAAVSVLLTTGYNEELAGDTARNRTSDILSKPYRRSELLDRIRQALNRRGEGAPRRRVSDYGAAEA